MTESDLPTLEFAPSQAFTGVPRLERIHSSDKLEEARLAGEDCPRLLCVDDDPFVLEGLQPLLERSYRLSTATSGATGLDLLDREGPCAIVISDMRMPNM